MSIGAISWNILWTYDLPTTAAWYENVLGLKVRIRKESVVSFDTGHTVLNLMARHDNGPEANPGTTGWDRNQVLFVFHVEDMEAALAELAERGAEPWHIAPIVIEGQPKPRWRVAQFMDPEGNVIELCDEPVRWNPFIEL
ncbi:MAG: VOC family protein [Nocardioidaceae bacterium]|nr:MAG: VOC family protein [Nocardioidaceae bacterium]